MAKSNKKQALGRGLAALLSDPENDIENVKDEHAEKLIGNIVDLNIDHISVNPEQPRTNFKEENLHELAVSIKNVGLIQPITVRKLGFNDFQIISGERRYRASKHIGLTTIPAYVRLAEDYQVLEMALVENIQRDDLDPIEIALSFSRLIDEIKLTQEALSKRVGKKRSTISNYLRLLKLNPIIQSGIRDGFLSMGHGRALVNLDKESDQLSIYKKIISDGISVRETERLTQNLQNQKQDIPSQKKSIAIPEYITKGQDRLKNFFSKEVDVKLVNSKKGKLIISFKSKDEFQEIMEKIK